jgi:simple sugar transport system permease protein
MLLAAGLGGVVVAHASGSAWAGVGAGVLVGACMGALHAALVVRAGVDAIVSGIALNLAAAGGTRFVLRALFDSSSNSPPVTGFPGRFEAAGGVALLASTLLDPLALATAAITLGTVWTLARTRFGLRVRACGHDPEAAAIAGVDVAGVRLGAVILGGAVCGLGGVALAYDQHQFQSGMSGGRGFIALAAVVLARWRPGRAVAACAAFAALDATQVVMQDRLRAGATLAQMLPYGAALAAMWALGRRQAGRG